MPLHPAVVHFPIAIAFILPILILIFSYFIKTNKMSPSAWFIIIGLQAALTGSAYLALETGETDEDVVEKVVTKKLIHTHEEKAEIFVGVTVLALLLSIATYFIRSEIQFNLRLIVTLVSLIGSFLAYQTGSLGGELVYRYGAAGAHSGATQGLTSQKNDVTSGQAPKDINESLKADENDYGLEEDYSVEDELKEED